MEKLISAWPRLLAALADGELVKVMLAREGIDRNALRMFLSRYPERNAEWQRAKEDSAVAFMEEALEVARDPGDIARDDKGEPIIGKDGKPLIIALDSAHARTRIDTLKWAARLRNPREYSDKAQLDINVKTVDLTRIISEANARLAAGRAPRTIEHEIPAALGHAASAAISEQAKALLELL